MPPLPTPGAVFAFAPRPGTEVHLRCVAAVGSSRCVVMTRSSGPLRKTAKALFEVQPLTHHEWNRPLLGGWVEGPPPRSVKSLGVVKLKTSEAERVLHPEAWVKLPRKSQALARKVLPVSSWSALLDEVRAQWRWEHEREAVRREDAAREAAQVRSLEAALAQSEAADDALLEGGVRGLAGRRFFTVWDGEQPKALVTAAERAMREALADLEGLGPQQAAKRLAVLMQRFNALHAKTPFDEDVADDVLDALLVVAAVCGISPELFQRVVDGGRRF